MGAPIMELSSFIPSIVNLSKSTFKWILKLLGKKIVKTDEYETETVVVKNDYPEQSPKCIQEKENGSSFYWSSKYLGHKGYEEYYEINIEENKKRYFKNASGRHLWIKRPKKDTN